MSLLFPKNGIQITNTIKLNYPTFKELFLSEKNEKKDISNIISLAETEEKKLENDSAIKTIDTVIHPIVKLNINIEYKNKNKDALDNFFNSLNNVSNEKENIRILHYGDSQIEGDRISDYLRSKLQSQFGGKGPGLISFLPVTPSIINQITWSNNWDRYTVFTGKDKRVKHNFFGALAHFTRFSNYTSINDSNKYKNAWIKIITSKNGGTDAAAFNTLKLFYGGAKTKTHVELYENGSLNSTDSLLVGGVFNLKTFSLNQKVNALEFKFTGQDSPDFYGISLEGDRGVMVDNIGLRGSSGTFFNQINFNQLKQFYDYLNTKLIILQFGGNALPNMTTPEQAIDFGRYLKAQINTIKKLAPQASILIIGPADMSVKNGTEYETHPQLENVRDAIKNTAFETDCAFFDMYNCMGGKNSMISWVDLGIGAKDYIHFSAGGARKIAVLLYSSLINDYNAYLNKKNSNAKK